jgi:pimeloyl-ACP methyl ester carboxylesterase
MKSEFVLGLSSAGFHRIHYTAWGNPEAPDIVVCVHGLSRNGRDFDRLAQALLPECRVVCPDIVGRGKSDWLAAKDDYSYPQYCADMAVLIARVTAGRADSRILWVGTSMGGIIGMLLASRPNTPISRLVVNDIGAMIQQWALERIAGYIGQAPRFSSLKEVEDYVRRVSEPFGSLSDEEWNHLATHSALRDEDGSWRMRYDPAIAAPFRTGALADVDLWPVWDTITCPVLLLRGAQSDLLPRDTAAAMTRRGPRPRLVEFAGVGHAPVLMAREQIDVVRDFLLS